MRKYITYTILFLLMFPFAVQAASPSAALVGPLWIGLRSDTDKPLAGGYVYSYEAGTSTLKSLYLDAQEQNLASNPVQLDSYGRASVFCDGIYKFVVKTSAGVTVNYPNLDNYICRSQMNDGYIDARSYNSGTLTSATLQAANDAITSAGVRRTLYIAPGTWAISTAVTFSSLVNVKVEAGAILTKSGSGSITFSSGSTLDAGSYQIFSGFSSGDVTISQGLIKAAWFGFNTASSASVNAAAIQSAITSTAGTIGKTIRLHAGTFAVAPDVISLVGYKNVLIEGEGTGEGYESSHAGTTLQFSVGTIGISLNDTSGSGSVTAKNTIKNIKIDGNGVLSKGITLRAANSLESVSVENCLDAGIWIPDYANMTRLEKVSATGNTGGTGYGLLVQGANSTVWTVKDSTFRQNTVGVRIEGGFNFALRDTVIESNSTEGLYIYKPTGGTISNGIFENDWLENNWAGGTGYQMVIDSQTQNYSSGPPLTLDFLNCNFNAINSEKHVNIQSARWVDFRNCNMQGGDTANGLLLGTYASYVYFFDGDQLTPVGSSYGNRGGYINKDISGTIGGLTTNMSIMTTQDINGTYIKGVPRTPVAASGHLDINLPSSTKENIGILSVASTNQVDATYQTLTVYAFMNTTGTTFTATPIGTTNGSGGAASFSLSMPSAGIVRVTDTNVGGNNVTMSISFVGADN